MDREKHCMIGPYYQVEIPIQGDLNEGDDFIGILTSFLMIISKFLIDFFRYTTMGPIKSG
jgi:hypothetical protein